MKIAINAQHLLKDKLEGIGWFAHETLSRITQNHPEHEFLFIFDRPWDKTFIYSDNITPVRTLLPSRHPFLWMWHYEVDIPRLLKKHKVDLFFSPDGWMSLRTNVPTVDVIHDINFIHRPFDFPFLPRKYCNYFFPLFARKARRLLTVSEYSKADIVASLGIESSKIDVSYNGCNPLFVPLTNDVKQEVKNKFTGGNPFFIYVGSQNPRKNIGGLLNAFEKFKATDQQNYKLLFVGKPMWGKSYLNDQVSQMKYKDDLVFTGRLPSESLQLVLASADALTLVSFSEGFGIPVIEAMHCEVPVICSNTASLPEVAGDAALFVNPLSIDEIALAMQKIATQPDLCNQLIIKGKEQCKKYSWDNTANLVWKTIERVLNEA
ncbi:MAG TPA: glycosyltransferase family 1 protein [Prolixibacteraceae bacterium]|nr:glycosyltransferase family 1 protein [Prolixibacteraceae bacterium]